MSVVQTLLSSHFSAAPPTHMPELQASPTVHASPSLHAPVLYEKAHPPVDVHESVVHWLPSAQTTTLPGITVQTPAWQLWAAHTSLVSQDPLESLVLTQPLTASHWSVVQELESSQFCIAPDTHLPPLHWSPVVHTEPSSQGEVVLTWTQPPVAMEHESVVQGLLSSQVLNLPPPQARPLQASPSVHRLPSSQVPGAGAWLQLWLASHASVLQTFPSSQSAAC